MSYCFPRSLLTAGESKPPWHVTPPELSAWGRWRTLLPVTHKLLGHCPSLASTFSLPLQSLSLPPLALVQGLWVQKPLLLSNCLSQPAWGLLISQSTGSLYSCFSVLPKGWDPSPLSQDLPIQTNCSDPLPPSSTLAE